MKIGIFDKVDEVVVSQLLKNHNIYWFDVPKDIDVAIIRARTKIDKAFLKEYNSLKYILMVGVGLDHIDLKECEKRNIKVFNAPASNANAVAEIFFLHLLNAFRKGCEANNEVKSKGYKNVDRSKFFGYDVDGKTLGFIGMGNIAKRIVKKLQGWNVKILAYDIYKDEEFAKKYSFEYVNLNYLLNKSDIITLHVPLLPETKNLINSVTLRKMKKGVILINLARGEIVEDKAILEGLNKGIISYYAADVLGDERNITKDQQDLASHPKVFLTPHIGAQTKESLQKATRQVIEKFLRSL